MRADDRAAGRRVGFGHFGAGGFTGARMKKAQAEAEAKKRRTAREGRQQALARTQRMQLATQQRAKLLRSHAIADRVEATPTRLSDD